MDRTRGTAGDLPATNSIFQRDRGLVCHGGSTVGIILSPDVVPGNSGSFSYAEWYLLPTVCVWRYLCLIDSWNARYEAQNTCRRYWLSSRPQVTRLGYCNPFLLLGTVFVSTAAGLFTRLNLDSSKGHWVGFQILSGAGIGFILQMVSRLLPPRDAY